MDNNNTECNLVQVKDYLILKRGNHYFLHQICNKQRAICFHADIDLTNVIGKPYWSFYRMELMKAKSKHSYKLELCDPSEFNTSIILNKSESGVDNRHIQDDNNAQSLTKNEIISMKDDGLSSQNILEKLVQNSKTFACKTGFAQEKYLQKKSNKYTDYIQVLKPNLRLLSHVLLQKSPAQLLNLRIDTLSQIITAVNFKADGKYIVYENNCQGLILAALLNLLNLNGKILNIVTADYPFHKRKALKAMQFSKVKLQRIINVNLSSFLQLTNTNNINFNSGDPIPEGDNLKRKDSSVEEPNKRTSQQQLENEEVRGLHTKKADGLVLVCKEIPNQIVKELLQFLSPSRSFVVYSQYREPLVNLFSELRQRKDIVCVRLFENWLRSYQILPDRTHPDITMSGTGGYLLTGITVLNDLPT